MTRSLPFSLLFVLSLLLFSPFLAIVTTASVSGEEDIAEAFDDAADEAANDIISSLVSDPTKDLPPVSELTSAPGVETVYFFPKNADKSTAAGEEAEVIVGVSNHGEVPLKVHSIWASLHVSYDHTYQIQNFTGLEFTESTVPPSVQASFPYKFTVSKYLQPGSFALVASILYEVDGQAYRNVFYNGTIEVVEGSGFVSGETIFLVTLGMGMLGLLGMWAYGQFTKISKKSRRTKKVETGTRSLDENNNEWLQGTAYTQKVTKSIAQPTKSKKKK